MTEVLNMSWEQPWYALIFILIGVIGYLLWNLYRWRSNVRAQFADSSLDLDIFGQKEESWLNAKNLFLIISLIFLALALMGPLWGEEEQTLKREGIDIVFALDVSNSMAAEDVAPSRIEKAKMFIRSYIQTLGGDRIGLVAFAGEAYSISPLTSDYSALDNYIETFDTSMLWKQGTSLSSAIIESVNLLDESPNVSKAVILISDGEDHEEKIDDAIEYAQSNKVDIYTVGVGTTQPTPIPIVDANGIDYGYKEDDNGNTVLSSFHDEELRSIAEKTNGAYLSISSVDVAVNQIRNDINQLQKKAESEISTYNKKQQYQWFLGLAILFYFVYTLTPDKKYFIRI